MSWDYDVYLSEHISNVKIGFEWIKSNLDEYSLVALLPEYDLFTISKNIEKHDASKYLPEEYEAYDAYFYSERTKEVKDNFNYAWLHHIHYNPHHWQHWVLIEDEGYNGSFGLALDMPDNYILEMICDWWSFSWKKHGEARDYNPTTGLYEIFDWYEEHRHKIIFSSSTRDKVEHLLGLIRDTLDKIDSEYQNMWEPDWSE